MKIRTGFVSNSSSSSFLIGLDRKPTHIKDLQESFWSPEHCPDKLYSLYDKKNEYGIETERFLSILLKDLAKPATKTDIINFLTHYQDFFTPPFPWEEYNKVDRSDLNKGINNKKVYKQLDAINLRHSKMCQEWAKKRYDELKMYYPKIIWYIVNYEDLGTEDLENIMRVLLKEQYTSIEKQVPYLINSNH